jgi:glycosyltransferase involved in cell wall biosynthesis
MNVSVIVATCGDDKWRRLAVERALPSAMAEVRDRVASHVLARHYDPHVTVAEARNWTARASDADWLCFLDADDELEPGYLDAMEAANEGWVYPKLENGWETGVPPLLVPKVRRVKPFVAESPHIPNKGGWPEVNECVIGTLVHRSLFEQVGGFRNRTDDGTAIGLYEDWDLWLRCHAAGAELRYTDAVYREHVNPTGRNYSASPFQAYDAIWRDHVARIAA